MQKITPFLWFDKECEEAVNFYVKTFNDAPSKQAESKVVHLQYYPEGGEGPMAGMEGKILTAIFELAGQRFMALDGGPVFTFNEAVSLYVECADQAEVDYFWGRLSARPESEQCGWAKDKYGVSWQIIPTALTTLMSDPDPEKAGRVMHAMLKMKKIVIADLEKAYRGE